MTTAHQTGWTLWERWRSREECSPNAEAIVHWVAGEQPYRWTWTSLLERARQFATWLAISGVRAGDVCALIVRHHRDVYPLYMGIVAMGGFPTVLAYPNRRLHAEKFRQGLSGMAQHSGLDWILTERVLEPTLADLTLGERSSIRGLLFPLDEPTPAAPAQPPPIQGSDDPHDECLLQHSSGTTGLQKGVMLSHRAVIEHSLRYADAIALNPADRIISWLPLYHDMGLIASFHLALLSGIALVQLDPFEWVSAPVLFFEAISQERGTLAWLPNFAYNFMSDRIKDDDLEGLRLDSVRMLVNCSEPIQAESHDRFLRRFADWGLAPTALGACYAMAEATFCVTQTKPGVSARRLRASRQALAEGRRVDPAPGEPQRMCVSSGRPMRGCRVRAVYANGQAVPDDHIGELVVGSPCLFDGYRNNPGASAEVLHDGWYWTGDYGFLHDGECYVVGRKKDVIIVAGRNLYPEDIENAVAEVQGVTPGRLVAVGVPQSSAGTEQVCVLVESEPLSPDAANELRLAILRAGMAIDVTIAQVHLVPPRWLIKSSSGKPSRTANRERLLNEAPAW